MSTVVNFFGKDYVEPGAYAATVYNSTSVSNVANFGNAMIIDTGLSTQFDANASVEFAGGAGIDGEKSKGLKSIYEFTSIEDFLSFTGGGLLGNIAKKLFSPIDGVRGIPKLYYVRAATTTCATITLNLDTGVNLILKCKNEGVCGNGNASNGVLKNGYAAKIVAGDWEGFFKLQLWKGTFGGNDVYGEPYEGTNYYYSQPVKVAESDNYNNLNQLYSWANYGLSAFCTAAYEGSINTALKAVDLTLATGGTTVYSTSKYSDVLEAITELDVTFFLCTNISAVNGAGVSATDNGKLFTFLKQEAKFKSFMVVPGGGGDTDLFGETNSSQSIAKYYDSNQVVVVHGTPEVPRMYNYYFDTKSLYPIYLAATVIGLNAGGAVQTPLTQKRVGYKSFVYDLKKRERERALQAGIIHVKNVSGYWVINQGITTLQNNLQTYDSSGNSFELSVELIKAQINKELILDGQVRFVGITAAQASPTSVKNFVETKLASLVAKPGSDNLLISWKNVKVVAKNGDYRITYDFVPNVPVNKLFFIGNVLDFTVNV